MKLNFKSLNKILIIILILFFILINSCANNHNNVTQNTQTNQFPLEASPIMLFNTFRNVLIDNFMLEIFNNNLEPYTLLNGDKLGILNTPLNLINISSSYEMHVACLSVIWQDQNYLTTLQNWAPDIEEWIDYKETQYVNDPNFLNTYLSDNLEFNEWLNVKITILSHQGYISYLQTGINERHWGENIDLEYLLNNMDKMWGVSIRPQEDHDILIKYIYQSDQSSLTIEYYFDGEIVRTMDYYIQHSYLVDYSDNGFICEIVY